jgi:hypothetical protein
MSVIRNKRVLLDTSGTMVATLFRFLLEWGYLWRNMSHWRINLRLKFYYLDSQNISVIIAST